MEDPNSWNVEGVGSVETPFDIESILRADSRLFGAWQVRPFYFTKAADGSAIMRYMDEDAFAGEWVNAS